MVARGSNMGSSSFFSKLASVDPLAQALHLPGATKAVQAQQKANAGTSAANGGPYTGVTPTLAAAAGGYQPGGPGANAGWRPWAPSAPGGIMGGAQRFSAGVGQTTPNPAGGSWMPSAPNQVISTMTGGPSTAPGMGYVQAARQAQAQNQSTYGTGFGKAQY